MFTQTDTIRLALLPKTITYLPKTKEERLAAMPKSIKKKLSAQLKKKDIVAQLLYIRCPIA